MKTILLSLFVLVTLGLSEDEFGITVENPKLIKRITKRIAKIWPDKIIKIDTCSTENNKNCNISGSVIVILEDSEIEYQVFDTLGYIYGNRVFSCRPGDCMQTSAEENTKFDSNAEFFDYFAILDPDGKLLNIDIYNYQATHGQEVCSRGWLKQFVGFSGSQDLIYGKNIQAISGATISGIAITYDIQKSVKCLSRNLRM